MLGPDVTSGCRLGWGHEQQTNTLDRQPTGGPDRTDREKEVRQRWGQTAALRAVITEVGKMSYDRIICLSAVALRSRSVDRGFT